MSPLIVRPATNDLIKQNYANYKEAFRICQGKMRLLIKWHSDAAKQQR